MPAIRIFKNVDYNADDDDDDGDQKVNIGGFMAAKRNINTKSPIIKLQLWFRLLLFLFIIASIWWG